MIIKVSSDLRKEEIWANGHELASIMGKDRSKGKRVYEYPPEKKAHVYTFKNPVLMTDNYRIGKLAPTLRDTLFSLFNEKPRIVAYDRVSVFWDSKHSKVWCPSIDTMVYAKALRKLFKQRRKFGRVVEIGCGSGFLSKYVLAKAEIKSILVNDINNLAIECAKGNIQDSRASFSVGDGLKKIANQKFDLIICNPPYVPRPRSIRDNAYEGTGLLDYLIHEGQKYLTDNGVLVINVSSLCYNEIFKRKPQMDMEVLETMEVPLKVNNILNSKSWVSYLRSQGLKKNYHQGYEYWQKLNIIQLTKKE